MLIDAQAPTVRLRTWFALLLAALFIGLIAFAPARLFEGIANRALGPGAQLKIAMGTVWSGRGALLLAGPSSAGNGTSIPLSWRVDPMALLRLRAGVALTADSAALTGKVKLALGIRSIEIRDANLRIDASLITAVSSMAGLLGPAGMLQLDTDTGESVASSYRGVPLAGGKLKLRAENVLLRTLSPRTFGSYDIDIVLRDAAADYRITQASGPLKLDGGGSVQWTTPRQFIYSGIASAAPDAADILAPLRNIGRPLPDGRLQIDFQGGW